MKERDDALWMAPWAPRVLKFNRPFAGGFLGLTALRAEGCGSAHGHAFGVRVQRVQKVQRVQRVVDCRSAAIYIYMPPYGGSAAIGSIYNDAERHLNPLAFGNTVF